MKKTEPIYHARKPNCPSSVRAALCGWLALTYSAASTHGAELIPSGGTSFDNFGLSVSVSGSTGLVGNGGNPDSVYYYRNLDTAVGTVTENVELTVSGGASAEDLGTSVSVSGKIGIAGAPDNDDNGINSGTAYVYRNLDTAVGTVTEDVQLIASDGADGDGFGSSVGVSGMIGLVGAQWDDDNGDQSGSAYVYRNLDTTSGTVSEAVKLTASDGASSDLFGLSVSISGTTGLVGARWDDNDNGADAGSAYVYRNLDTASGTVIENVKLTASDGAAADFFGYSVSVSGTTGLVGARSDDDNGNNSGSAYVYRNLDTASGTATEDVKLTASDGAASDFFGRSVSVSGTTGLVGARSDDDNGNDSGSVYLYSNLDTVFGTVNENVKLTASDGAAGDLFGHSVGIDGDDFLIGAFQNDAIASNAGKAYTGSVSSVTTLDEGNASRAIDGISFVSLAHWVVGESTDANQVTLGAGDSGDVTAVGKSVFVGRNAGSDNNQLILEGGLTATEVRIGSETGNAGNTLQIAATGSFDVSVFYLAADNLLEIEGDVTGASALLSYLDTSDLQVENDSGVFEVLTSGNFDSLVATTFDGTYTSVSAVPEPSAYALIFGLLASAFAARRRRHR